MRHCDTRAGGMAQVVEHILSKHKSLSSKSVNTHTHTVIKSNAESITIPNFKLNYREIAIKKQHDTGTKTDMKASGTAQKTMNPCNTPT
jgi:microcystin-dependent protein